jgi:hypothetical protein
VDEREVAGGIFVEAGEHPAEVLELADEALDQVALLVGRVVAGARHDAALLRRDGGDGVQLLLDIGHRLVRVVASVGDDFPRLPPRQQRDRLRVVARGPTRQDELQRVTQGVDEDVDLRAEPAP